MEALDRLHAPRFEFTRYWATVTCTDPDGKGVHFFPRVRRTWILRVHGYLVFQLAGKVRDHERRGFLAGKRRDVLLLLRPAPVRGLHHPHPDDR